MHDGRGIPTRESTVRIGEYTLVRLRGDDVREIPDGFRRVYGEDYLSAVVYDAAALSAAIRSGEQISFLARDGRGGFAGHIALKRSAPNPRLFEVAQGIVVAEHRKAGIFRHLFDAALNCARADPGCDGFFGTALTNHTISQRVLSEAGLRDVGFEIDYVPQRMMAKEGAAGAIATVVQYLGLNPTAPRPANVPERYRAWTARLLAICGEGTRVVAPRGHRPLPASASRSETVDLPRFDMARLALERAGADLLSRVAGFERTARRAGRRTAQVLVNLEHASAATAIGLLRARGYAYGGLLPRYCADGAHAGLLYKSFGVPNFAEIKPYSEDARWLLGEVVGDWRSRPAGPIAAPGALGGHASAASPGVADLGQRR